MKSSWFQLTFHLSIIRVSQKNLDAVTVRAYQDKYENYKEHSFRISGRKISRMTDSNLKSLTLNRKLLPKHVSGDQLLAVQMIQVFTLDRGAVPSITSDNRTVFPL